MQLTFFFTAYVVLWQSLTAMLYDTGKVVYKINPKLAVLPHLNNNRKYRGNMPFTVSTMRENAQ